MREDGEWRTGGAGAAGMPEWTHLTQPVAPGTSEPGLSCCVGQLDPGSATLLGWAVVRTQWEDRRGSLWGEKDINATVPLNGMII